ncbi:MAG: hypothetical protein C0514_04510 [Candidatus Puniceispirillum sp.]|nr:hypothetical protein [Candidatus Puniceispirillum sp.]
MVGSWIVYILKKQVVILVCVMFQAAFASSQEPEPRVRSRHQDISLHEEWLPLYLTQTQKETLLTDLQARKDAMAPPVQLDGKVKSGGRYYGTLTPFTVAGMTHVRSLTAGGAVPKVLDVGAGDGFHAGLLVLAGGHVTLLENDTCLVDTKTNKNVPGRILVNILRGYLPEGVAVKDRTRIVVGDALKTLAKAAHQGAYDFINAANVLHCMTPRDAESCVRALYGALKPGGVVHARVHALSAMTAIVEGSVLHIYSQEVEKGARFPGWMLISTKYDREHFGFTQVTPLDAMSDHSPMETHYTKSSDQADRPDTLESSMLCFDVATLKRLFEGAGFVSQACQFEGLDDSLTQVQEGQETFVNAPQDPGFSSYHPCVQDTFGAANICYVAAKPL